MASLDSLPADQRAVLQLVLQRARSYDEIAQMLALDRAAVRDRALSAFDALGPQTRVPPERRALITDYLLRQLPPRVADEVRNGLAESPTERAWARVLASELAPLASGPLPEIPVEAGAAPTPAAEAPAAPEPEPPAPGRRAPRSRRAAGAAAGAAAAAPAARAAEAEPTRTIPPDHGLREPQPPRDRPISRRGGAIVLGVVALVVVVVAIVLIASGGSSKKHTTGTQAASTSTTAASTPTTATTRVVAQINLTSPSGAKTAGIAEVLKQGSVTGIAIVAQNVPANTRHDAYAVWLYNSATDSHLLGFVNPAVGANGRLQTAGALPANASRFKQLIVTLETRANPPTPGPIVLQGALSGV
jgi:hypothetical protein